MISTNINNVVNLCATSSQAMQKIDSLLNFVNTKYLQLDEELQAHFGTNSVENLKQFTPLRKAFEDILAQIASASFDENYLENLPENVLLPLDNLYKFVFRYANGKCTLNDIKYCIYLAFFRIDYNKYKRLSDASVMALIELLNYNVDITKFEQNGNFYIGFVNRVANNTLNNTQFLKELGLIALTVDECMYTDDSLELPFEGGALIFEKDSEDTVSIYDEVRLDKPLAVIDEDNNFIVGSIDLILNHCAKISSPSSLRDLDNLLDTIETTFNEMID